MSILHLDGKFKILTIKLKFTCFGCTLLFLPINRKKDTNLCNEIKGMRQTEVTNLQLIMNPIHPWLEDSDFQNQLEQNITKTLYDQEQYTALQKL